MQHWCFVHCLYAEGCIRIWLRNFPLWHFYSSIFYFLYIVDRWFLGNERLLLLLFAVVVMCSLKATFSRWHFYRKYFHYIYRIYVSKCIYLSFKYPVILMYFKVDYTFDRWCDLPWLILEMIVSSFTQFLYRFLLSFFLCWSRFWMSNICYSCWKMLAINKCHIIPFECCFLFISIIRNTNPTNAFINLITRYSSITLTPTHMHYIRHDGQCLLATCIY